MRSRSSFCSPFAGIAHSSPGLLWGERPVVRLQGLRPVRGVAGMLTAACQTHSILRRFPMLRFTLCYNPHFKLIQYITL